MGISPWISKFDEIANSVAKGKALMIEDGQRLTYGDLFEDVRRSGSFIRSLGLNTNDRVILATRDHRALVILFFSLLRNGITSVILNPGASKIEAQNLAETADVKAVFADRDFLEQNDLSEVLGGHISFTTIDQSQSANQGFLGKMLGKRKTSSAEVDSYPAVLNRFEKISNQPQDIHEDTLAYILFTSGTTSRPKGVEISHKNLFAQEQTFFNQYQFDNHVQLLNVLPMFHTDGLTHGPVLAFFAGATLHRPAAHFRVEDLPHVIRSVYTDQITHMITVPSILALLQNHDDDLSDAFRTDEFKFLISTAAYLDPNLWQEMENRYGIRIVNVYGLTETVCEAIYCGPDQATRKVGTIGKPVDCEARIVDDDERDVKQGEVGELILKGDHVMLGYFRQPEETAKVLKEGWFFTGDLAKVDDDGFYQIVGRKKNVIITAGINVYPEDVTTVIRAMPGVVDAITFGLEDDTWGERVISCIQAPENSELTVEAVASYCATNLAREKIPNKIFVFPELPRGPAGKVVINEAKDWVRKEIEKISNIELSGGFADQVIQIAARTFKMTKEVVNAETNPETAPGWNSLAHVEFLMEIEKHFKIQISPREIMQISRVGDAIDVVERKMAA